MRKLQGPHRTDARTADSTAYRPALDAYARRLIARIQRDQFDTQAVLALKAHYEAHDDQASLANLMEGWGQILREPSAAADAYIAAADAVLAAAGDRARARHLYQRALECSPQRQQARARLEALERTARATPPPPPVPRRASGTKLPRAISEIRSIEGNAVWLDDQDLQPLDDSIAADSSAAFDATGRSRARRYEETQRIWRPQAS